VRRPAAALLLGTSLLLAACATDPGPTVPGSVQTGPVQTDPAEGAAPSPTPATPAPTPSGPSYSTFPLGERALPLRPDGFGEIRPTPPSLRVRRYPTVDVLPPPEGGRFASSIGPITPAVRERMGETHQAGCPVALADLRYVEVTFRGFDGDAHTGELVVAASAAEAVVSVFRTLFRADFPIEEMRLITTADLEAPATGDGNNTAAYICRPTRGSTTLLSAHAYGLALDLNPFMNPYLRDDVVLPERASSYLDRSRVRPGMVLPESLAVREFARIGWSWGGDFQSLKDYQHFTALDR
jgi:hypothetical protein